MAHTLASTSSSSSASAHSNYSYDVFLNHRGTDVKKTFASHLYRRLLSYGFRVFLDQPEMQRGEKIDPQIERAIETASVYVAIFSPRYAESRWCLDELVLMLKSGATIIPVFYNVEPSDLRWTTDNGKYTDRLCAQALRLCCWPSSDRVYTEALLIHEKKGRYDQERLAAWRKALSDVSSRSGFELEAYNGDEGELVDEVARQVQKKVTKAPLHVAKHPTGLDEKLQDFEKTVSLEEQLHRGGTILLGIIGLGGVGKTTLAKEFFNRNRSIYQRSCFLAEVRDAAARNTLTSLQGQLCKDLTGVTPVMCSIYEGMGQLSHLRYSQSLIILDDVEQDEQLDALFSPLKDVLPSGSLILVTSRDKGVLRKSAGIQESSIYKMTGLSWETSRALFCSHAFHQPYPDVGYEELVSEFLSACQGLPLSLKVIGALLHSESPEYWKDQLHKLSQVLPTEIQNRLKISYDSLDKQEKEIFLDIACFFIGIKRDTAIRLWDGSGWKGSLGLGTLETKCLVTLDKENCIRMHDHLRDLGRDLAEKEPPGCPRRLWRPTDNLFRNVPTQSMVRGISMVQQRYGESFQSTAEFSNRNVDISGLQLLRAPCDCLESLFKVVIHPYILWLRCEIYSDSSLPSWIQINNSDSSLPSWIPIKNLRVLELVEQECWHMPILGTLWNTESEAPLQLRELNISFELFRLPKSMEQLKYLEKIELPNFKGTLPEEFFHLPSLKHLRLRAGMKSLPDSLGNFTNLQHIDLSGCEDLQTLPPSFGNLTKLQHVKLEGCGKLKMLPDSFMNLIRLKHLELSNCCDLTLSDQTLGNISTLERLNFSECHKIEGLAPQVTHQPSLEELILDYTQLKELPSAIGDLRQLTSLSIMGCPIREVPFASVEKVQGGSRLLDSSIDMCMLRLNSLDLSLTRITEISFGEGVCPVLESLDLGWCDDLVEVGALPTTLTSLKLRVCCALKKITGLRGLAKLRYLDMSGCKEIEELPGLGVWELNNLENLYLRECPISVLPFASVEKVQGGRRFLDSSIDKCMLRLESLSLSKTTITEISFGEGVCPVLQSLDLAGCDDLVEVGALPTTLTSLDLKGCCALKKITGLRGLAKLRSLDMSGCKEIEELPGLGVWELNNLENLNLQECPISVLPFASVEKVQGGRRFLDSSIDNCMLRLKSLSLSKTTITEISFGEGVCPVLQSLDLAGCDDLVEVGALPTTLTSLDMKGCCALKKITGLRGLAKLRSLDMSGCKEIEELPGLGVWELNNLENLNLQECPISVLPFASVEKVQGGRRFLDSSIDNCMLRLKSLSLSKTTITEISFGEGVCPVLESLDLGGCDDLVEVGALPTTLTSLDMKGCCALKKITGLRGLAKLRSLDMSGCKEIEELPGLGVWELNNLENLNLQECPISVLPFASVEKVQGGRRFLDFSIDKCMLRLKSLSLSKTRITEISFGEGVFPVLESLDLAGCDDLVEVGALPTTLTSLDLKGCCALKKITGLRGLAKLRSLNMSGYKEIEELPGLGVWELNSLEKLYLRECPISVLPFASVEKVQGGRRFLDSSIDNCILRLKSLSLSKTRITEISFVEGVCPVLDRLSLRGCDDLVEVGALPTTLTSLILKGCCALKKITRLRGLAKLRYLNMSGCKEIEELPGLGVWELNNLEKLYLRECPISVLPFASVEKVQGGRRFLDSSIDKCMLRLKSLSLSKTRITEISFGEGVCPVLDWLSLAGCDDLVEVGALPTTLTSLKLTGCCALKKITGLRGVAKLRSLDMSGCKEIEELPGPGVWELNNLENLNLQECPISVLPFVSVEKVQGGRRFLDSSIDNCMLRLKSLSLSKTRITEISFGEGVCPVLQSLDLAGCDDLVEVGALPTTLTSLDLKGCCALKKITGLRGLAKLRSLDMSGCKEIEELAGLGVWELNNLENLNLQECPISVLPFASVEKVQGGRRFLDSSIDNCMLRLKSLSLSKTTITEISFGEGVCPVLQSLDLAGCDDLVEVGALPTTLTSLDLKGCCALKKIRGLRGLAKLRSLDMSGCKEIEELPGLGVWELNNLENLNLQECPISVLPFASVEKVQGGRRFLDSSIDNCMLRLKSLSLSKTTITEISFGEGVCPVLQSLDLAGCDDLVEVGALPTTLTSLDMKGCCALKKITGLRGLAKLRSLDMSGCKEIEELPGLGVWELNNLENLNLQECPISVLPFASVEKVQGGRRFLDSSIDNCILRLKSLSLSKTRIIELSFGEGVCPVLESLDLAGCDDLVEVGALPTTLTSLYLKDCSALRKITGLRGLAKLRDLDMAGCYTVEELPGLETLISVEVLLTPECENMKRIRELAEAANPESDVLKKVIQLMERDEEN